MSLKSVIGVNDLCAMSDNGVCDWCKQLWMMSDNGVTLCQGRFGVVQLCSLYVQSSGNAHN